MGMTLSGILIAILRPAFFYWIAIRAEIVSRLKRLRKKTNRAGGAQILPDGAYH
jgi:hypothetical protein